MAQSQAEIIRDGLVHIQYALKQFYPKQFSGTGAQRRDAQTRMWQTIDNYLGSVITQFKKEFIDVPDKQLIAKRPADGGIIDPFTNTASKQIDWLVKMADVADNRGELELANQLDLVAQTINNLETIINGSITSSSKFPSLAALADELDRKGHYDLADKMDDIIERSNENLNIVNELVEVADALDKKEEYKLAEAFDKTLGIIKTANDYSFFLSMKALEEQANLPPIQSGSEGHLSTRYCPDHRGVQAIRVAERAYQCPIDGKTYNYETGYKNYKGQMVPGGSVAKQTPETSNYGIPMRFYDSRQNILKSMH